MIIEEFAKFSWITNGIFLLPLLTHTILGHFKVKFSIKLYKLKKYIIPFFDVWNSKISYSLGEIKCAKWSLTEWSLKICIKIVCNPSFCATKQLIQSFICKSMKELKSFLSYFNNNNVNNWIETMTKWNHSEQ